jgi:hypothetical protein
MSPTPNKLPITHQQRVEMDRELDLNYDSNLQRLQKRWEEHNRRNQEVGGAVFVHFLDEHFRKHCNPSPYHTSIRRDGAWIFEILNSNNERVCLDHLRMRERTFKLLRRELEKKGLCHSRHVTNQEALAIFLYTINNGARNRQVGDTFQRSERTISHHFHRVLDAIVLMYDEWVIQPKSHRAVDCRIATDSKYTPYFDNCVGALDRGARINVCHQWR